MSNVVAILYLGIQIKETTLDTEKRFTTTEKDGYRFSVHHHNRDGWTEKFVSINWKNWRSSSFEKWGQNGSTRQKPDELKSQKRLRRGKGLSTLNFMHRKSFTNYRKKSEQKKKPWKSSVELDCCKYISLSNHSESEEWGGWDYEIAVHWCFWEQILPFYFYCFFKLYLMFWKIRKNIFFRPKCRMCTTDLV